MHFAILIKNILGGKDYKKPIPVHWTLPLLMIGIHKLACGVWALGSAQSG